MADPRFYDNRGPFRLAELCEEAGLDSPPHADGGAWVLDVAGLEQAGPPHLSFYDGRRGKEVFLATQAGWCLAGKKARDAVPPNTVLLPSSDVGRVFARIARRFYPQHELDIQAQDTPIHRSAKLGEGIVLAPGVIIGPDAEIGDGTRIGAYSVIGRGVTIGRRAEIGSHVWVGFAHLGDDVLIQPGVKIGASGFGFSSGPEGHLKIPQLGRVIIQDRVELGSNSTVDRGSLGDTVVGEGTKIDNLVQIGHNSQTGRHCIIAGQAGLSGSAVLGDFVIVGGKTGVSDHVTVGDRARFAGLSGVARDMEGGRDYGGIPARPIREWHRETALVAKLARKGKRSTDE
jgi:UDP-3-O-[3-hydroxymyristoyl] glucosamine N-acyltransferase